MLADEGRCHALQWKWLLQGFVHAVATRQRPGVASTTPGAVLPEAVSHSNNE
jgi:hypothetical protein